MRGLVLGLVRRAWQAVTRKDIQRTLDDFQATLKRGLLEIQRRPRALMLPLLLIGADRLARIGVVWVCFQALGSDVGLGVLVTGFAVGVALGVMSMVPGGLGVQEGSMAGTYHLLGVPLEEAVLVAVLFRLVYYMVPFLVSLAFYRRILREGAAAAGRGGAIGHGLVTE